MNVRFTRQGVWITDGFRRARRHSWRVLLLFALIPGVLAVSLVIALNRSMNFKWFARAMPLDAAELFVAFSRTSAENVLVADAPPVESELPTLELQVSRNALATMHAAILEGDPELAHEPGGDTPYLDAWFIDESGETQKAKIAYRGSYHYHHWPEKPSLRIKIRKDDIAIDRRYVELTRPKDALGIRHQFPEYLARGLDIVTTRNEAVRLFINGRYFGVYLRSYRPGEALALANGRMPGTWFKGDAVAEQEGVDLWESAAPWSVFGEAAPEDAELFEQFLENLRSPATVDSVRELHSLLDPEVYARWSAAMIVTGCSHTDRRHNQMYYVCSNQGRLEPVPWDPTCYEVAGRAFTPVDIVNDPVMDRMIRNPLWVHRRNELIHELLSGVGSEASFIRHIDEELRRRLPDLKADMQLSRKTTEAFRVPRSVLDIDDEAEEMREWARAKIPWLRTYLGTVEIAVEADPDNPAHSIVSVSGNVSVRATTMTGERVDAFDWTGGTTELLHSGRSADTELFEFQPEREPRELPCVSPVWLTYKVALPADQLRFHNAVTGTEVSASGSVPQVLPTRTLPPSAFERRTASDVVLGPGLVTVESDIRVPSSATLTIQPGTTLRLRAGTGIYSQGRVTALGTAEQPIVLEAADAEPWAAFGVHGAETAGSVFEHMSVNGGSVGRDTARFKGMFSVYDCPSVLVSNCTFGPNQVGDDAVNLAESQVSVTHCRFHDALADGLDLDLCTGNVSHCTWQRSGNDGLDMMGCRIAIEACLFESSGDKGVSVGEHTEAVARDCVFRNCRIGAEIKDSSRFVAIDTLFDRNHLAYRAYRKKWLYPRGGSGLLLDCTIRSGDSWDLDIEERSDLVLVNSPVGGISEGSRRVETTGVVPADWQLLIDGMQSP